MIFGLIKKASTTSFWSCEKLRPSIDDFVVCLRTTTTTTTSTMTMMQTADTIYQERDMVWTKPEGRGWDRATLADVVKDSDIGKKMVRIIDRLGEREVARHLVAHARVGRQALHSTSVVGFQMLT
jgi:hypothetical protein